MTIKPHQIKRLIHRLDTIIESLIKAEEESRPLLEKVDEDYKKSARNLVHYKAFRQLDLRGLQKKLQNLGLTRFSNSEKHILASIIQTHFILSRLIDEKGNFVSKSGLSIKNGRRLLKRHTAELLGDFPTDRRVRIMVTQPSQSATDYNLVYDMVKNGMDCARINCAHDHKALWKAMINNVKKASKSLNKPVKITMDLGGPKIRTNSVYTSPKSRRFSLNKNRADKSIKQVELLLTSNIFESSPNNAVLVSPEWLNKLKLKDTVLIKDTGKNDNKLSVIKIQSHGVLLGCNHSFEVGIGDLLFCHGTEIESTSVLGFAMQELEVVLRPNDTLILTMANQIEDLNSFSNNEDYTKLAFIGCKVPEVYEKAKIGDPILFDDGKIEGLIKTVRPDHLEVKITKARNEGVRLKSEKGINLPDTDLGISGLTSKDRTDLAFIAKHADAVNFSFVNSKQDVEELFAELKRLNAFSKLDIFLKIETRRAFDNLSDIILTAMQTKYIGVMIARGDLAIETGWDNIGRIQQDILNLCSSAHIPVIWATQVFENFAKKGIPSRAEITDAVNALKAECVMLNKGPYIQDVLKLLNKILCQMELYYEKNEPMLPKMEKA